MSTSKTITPMSSASKPRIVDDLISVILESDDHWWPRDFQRLALVSMGWVGPIRRRLYRCPQLRSFQACTSFARTVSQNPQIRSLVRGIDLRPASATNDRPTLTERDMASLRYILSMDGFESVAIGGELAVQAERFIHMMANTRSITSLHIDGSYLQQHDGSLSCRPPASLEWNEAIAFRFTRLRNLKLTNLQLIVLEPAIPYSLRISSLIFTDINVTLGSIQNLCHESWSSVRTLSVTARSTQDADEFVRELLECCENLESFQYDAGCSGADGDVFEENLPLAELRKLRLFDVNISPQTLVILGQTCNSLESLSVLGRKVRMTGSDWNSFLRSGSLPTLKVLKTSAGTYEPQSGFVRWSQEAMQHLSLSCASRNVKLVCSA